MCESTAFVYAEGPYTSCAAGVHRLQKFNKLWVGDALAVMVVKSLDDHNRASGWTLGMGLDTAYR